MEAWGFRLMQHEHKFYDRAEVSRRWFTDEFTPVVRLLHAADLVGSGTDADAYLTIARERYRLIRTHEWNDEVIEELQRQFGAPRWRIRGSGAVAMPPDRHGEATHRHADAAAHQEGAAHEDAAHQDAAHQDAAHQDAAHQDAAHQNGGTHQDDGAAAD